MEQHIHIPYSAAERGRRATQSWVSQRHRPGKVGGGQDGDLQSAIVVTLVIVIVFFEFNSARLDVDLDLDYTNEFPLPRPNVCAMGRRTTRKRSPSFGPGVGQGERWVSGRDVVRECKTGLWTIVPRSALETICDESQVLLVKSMADG